MRRTFPVLSFIFFFLFFFHLTYSRWTSSLPSCLWSQRIFPSLPVSRLTFFLTRCKFSTLTTRQPMVEFYLLTFPRFPLRKKEHKSYFGKNRTHDFRTSRCAAYLLDHSGDELDNANCCRYDVSCCTYTRLCSLLYSTHTRIESHKRCPKSFDANVCGRTAVLAGTASSCRCKGLPSFAARHQYQ